MSTAEQPVAGRTYPLEVEGVGRFVFRKRRVPDQVRIEAAAIRMTGGPIDDAELENFCLAYQTLLALTVEAPAGWDLEEIDPLDREQTGRMWGAYEALRAEEARFRKGAGQQRAEDRA